MGLDSLKKDQNSESSNKRDLGLDSLRCLGLLMIILAHVSPPGWLFQIRNFDVPLMAMVSGGAFIISHRNESYSEHLAKRFIRLLGPTWVFLTLYFVFSGILQRTSNDLNFRSIVSLYCLSTGAGWVIRVFLLVSIVAPLVSRLFLAIGSKAAIALLAGLLFVYEILIKSLADYAGYLPYSILEKYILYAVPYGFVFAVGMFAQKSEKRISLFVILFFSLSVFAGCVVANWAGSGMFIPTQGFKYPPRLYYISYALAVSILLYCYKGVLALFVERLRLRKMVVFFSENSLWIYFWHTPFVAVIDAGFFVKYLLACIVAVMICWLQRKLSIRIAECISNRYLKCIFRTVLIG